MTLNEFLLGFSILANDLLRFLRPEHLVNDNFHMGFVKNILMFALFLLTGQVLIIQAKWKRRRNIHEM